MEINHIRSVLTTTNLIPQPETYVKVLNFLENDMGMENEGSDYQVLAAFAIISEVQKIKPVDNSQEVSTGIHLQTVMKHLGNYSKEMLLLEVIRQCQKWREAPSWLKAKIDSVNIAYRIYKKYRTLFQNLSKNYSTLDQQSIFNLMSICWVVYLFIKNSSGDANALDATRILQSLFKYVFTQILAQLEQALISKHFNEFFKSSEPLQLPAYQFYKNKIEEKLAEIQRERRGKDLDLIHLITNQHQMVRYLDDIGNHYDVFKAHLPAHFVDQLSFIELEKNLTPLPFKRSFPGACCITKKINFDSEGEQEKSDEDSDSKDDENFDKGNFQSMEIESQSYNMKRAKTGQENQQHTRKFSYSGYHPPVSPFRQITSPIELQRGTPVSARNQNLSWVNRITQTNQRQNMEQIKIIYEQYAGKDYSIFQKQAYQKIFAAINSFTPSCMDYNRRQRSLYAFFAFFIKIIYNQYQENQRFTIFSSDQYFNAILCLSTNIFNYAYQSLQSQYKTYCEIFGIGIIQGQIPINWIGKYADMPRNISIYLYELQKRILVQQIWDDGAGYNLITENRNSYQGQAFLKRIKKHAEERTQQLCLAMKIEYKQIGKIINLIRFILEKRTSLMKDHNIDQLIVCAITSIVSINRSQTMSLSQTFQHYNKLLFSLNISRSIFYDSVGNQIDILSYYNDVFLPQVDEIIYNQEQTANILNTPIRLDINNRLQRGGQLPLASLKFKQFSSEGLGKKKIKNESEEKYRNKLINNVLSMDINEKDEQNIEEDLPSPYFGVSQVLNKTYSFGDIPGREK